MFRYWVRQLIERYGYFPVIVDPILHFSSEDRPPVLVFGCANILLEDCFVAGCSKTGNGEKGYTEGWNI